MKTAMTPLELWLLKRLCDRYGLDYQEIDNKISYYQNRDHLESLFLKKFPSPWTDKRAWSIREAEWTAQMEEYFDLHFLESYVAAVEAGWTLSEKVGEPFTRKPPPPIFSLEEYIKWTQ